MNLSLLPTALLLLSAAPSASAQDQTQIDISGVVISVDGFVQLGFFSPPTPPCGINFDCFPGIWCTDVVDCTPFETGPAVAANLAAAINVAVSGCNGANPGFSAVAAGGTLTVTGPVGTGFACCLSTSEVQFCGAPGAQSVPLDGCVITNVCNGISCDENLPQVDGLQFSKSAVAVPAMGNWGLFALTLATAGAAILVLRRRASMPNSS